MNIIAFISICVSFALAIMDMSGTPVVLPAMNHSLNLSGTQTQWIINIYTLVLSVSVIPIGKMSDRFGLKKVFILGILTFIVGSVFCAAATNFTIEIIGRFIQGIGGATIFPVGIALIPKLVDPECVTHWIGKVVSINSLIYIVSGLVAGAFVQWFSWRTFFWINVPVGLIGIWLLWKKIPSIPIGSVDNWNISY